MLKQRITTAIILLALMGSMLFFAPDGVWAAFCALIAFLVLGEYSRFFALNNAQRIIYLTVSLLLLGGLCWRAPHLIQRFPPEKDGLLTAAAVAVLLFWLVFVPFCLKRRISVRSVPAVWIMGWVLLLPFWSALVDLRFVFGAKNLFLLMAVVWVADIGAYFVGKKFGRHKLAPEISPSKSREGAFGGLAGVLLYVYLLVPLFNGGRFWQWGEILLLLPVLCVLTAVSIVGDLWESHLKRRAGVKDSGSLLPGHGGVFDRADSLIAVLSLSYTVTVCAAWFLA